MVTIASKALALGQAESEPLWLFRSHVLSFPSVSGLEADLLYASLSAKASQFTLLPGAERQGKAVSLPLRLSRFCFVLNGELEQDILSAGHGERRQTALARFPLAGGASLRLKLEGRQELVSGRVKVGAEFWFGPGHSSSFRSVAIARGIRWALSRQFNAVWGMDNE